MSENEEYWVTFWSDGKGSPEPYKIQTTYPKGQGREWLSGLNDHCRGLVRKKLREFPEAIVSAQALAVFYRNPNFGNWIPVQFPPEWR